MWKEVIMKYFKLLFKCGWTKEKKYKALVRAADLQVKDLTQDIKELLGL